MRNSYKTIDLWVILIILFVAFYQLFSGTKEVVKTITYSDFQKFVTEKKVTVVNIKSTTGSATYSGTLADTIIVQPFTHVTARGDTLRLRNILARFKPAAAQRVLYLTHWDSRPTAEEAKDSIRRALPTPGANDGASGVALLLGVADALKKTAPALGVDLLFVDGEDYGDFFASGTPDVLIGARWYADHPVAPLPQYAVLLDMIGDNTLQIHQEGFSLSAAPAVVEKIWGMAARLGYSSTFIGGAGGQITDDHVEFNRVGIPAVDIIDLDYPWWHTKDDTIDKISATSLQIVGDVMMGVVREERP